MQMDEGHRTGNIATATALRKACGFKTEIQVIAQQYLRRHQPRGAGPRGGRRIGRVLALLAVAALIALLLTPTGCYLMPRGLGGGEDPRGRRPIDRARRGPRHGPRDAIAPAARARPRARSRLDSFGLGPARASRPIRSSIATRWSSSSPLRIATGSSRTPGGFPIVGRVPYKGFFDFSARARPSRATSSGAASTRTSGRRPRSAR